MTDQERIAFDNLAELVDTPHAEPCPALLETDRGHVIVVRAKGWHWPKQQENLPWQP